jgi:hypothetical protein
MLVAPIAVARLRAFLLWIALGSVVTAIAAGDSSIPVFGSLFTLWFVSGLPLIACDGGSTRATVAFSLSFIGGFLMFFAPLLVVVIKYAILPSGGCFAYSGTFPYYCWGTPAKEYYDTINTLVLAGVVAVCASIFYASRPRWYVASGIVSLFAAYVYVETALSTTIPVPFSLVSILAGAGGAIALVHGARTRGRSAHSLFFPKVIRALTKPIGVAILLMIAALGMVAGSWWYAAATAGSLQVACVAYSPVSGETVVGISNPSFFSVDAAWKITDNYTSAPSLRITEIESFHVPPHGMAYPHFRPLERPQAIVNSTYPEIIKQELHYNVMLWSFDQQFSAVDNGGKDFGGPAFPPAPTC